MGKLQNIGFVLPVESVSRKFARRVETVGNKATSIPAWIGAAHSTFANKSNTHPVRNYLVVRKMKSNVVITSDITYNRTRFAAVSRTVATRMQDLSQITQDQLAFLAQKDQPGGIKSLKGYVWSLELATYDAAHPKG